MYNLRHIGQDEFRFLELSNPEQSSMLRICLNQGGRLDALVLANESLLAEFPLSSYAKKYQSAILFPFVNRIKDGQYSFNNKTYLLHCNEIDKNNALHGLVYDKTFHFIKSNLKSDLGSVVLKYVEKKGVNGFPFKYNIELTYKLKKDELSLELKVENTDTEKFPFAVGWHPYFKSSNLELSSLKFDADEKFTFGVQQIPNGQIKVNIKRLLELKETNLDDCYPLKSNEVNFFTPNYDVKMHSSSKTNFLQLYTPVQTNVIAIEPMTAPADSFNNGIGLQILRPKENYTITWTVSINNKTN